MRKPRLSIAIMSLLCLSALGPPPVAAAEGPAPAQGAAAGGCADDNDAQRLAQQGLRLYKEAGALADPRARSKAYEQALRCYQAVVRVGKSAALIYHPMGLVYEKLERYVEAVEALERFLREVPEAQRKVGVTKQIDDKLRELDQRVARLDIDTPAGLEVRVDQRLVGKAPLGRLVVVLPGTHSVVVGDGERGTLGAQAVAEAGKVLRVDLSAWRPRPEPAQAAVASPGQAPLPLARPAPPAEARPLYKRWWLWGAVGLVAVGVTTAAVVATKPWEQKPAVYDLNF